MTKHTFFDILVLIVIIAASVLNLLYIAGIFSLRCLMGTAVAFGIIYLLERITYKKECGPLYYKNWRKNPKRTCLHLAYMLVLAVTFFAALYHSSKFIY